MTEKMTVERVLGVEGMHCAGCEAALRKVLLRLEGVLDAAPDHQGGRVAVRFDPARAATQQLVERIQQAGFQATATPTSPGPSEPEEMSR